MILTTFQIENQSEQEQTPSDDEVRQPKNTQEPEGLR
jgi:hypothetical protein